MSQAYRLPVLCIILGMAAAGRAGAQEPQRIMPERSMRERIMPERGMRAPFPRFEYRMPRLMLRMQPRLRQDAAELRLRALDRSFDRMERMREREFALRDRIQERMRERMDRYPMRRPFRFGPRSRTI